MSEPAMTIIAQAPGSPHKNTNIAWPAGAFNGVNGTGTGRDIAVYSDWEYSLQD